jgi:cold shock protein
MADEEKVVVTGVVRSYNDTKGFGLITPDLGGPPIFVSQSAIRTPGVKKLKVTDRVEYEVEIRPEGPAAANLRKLVN